MSNSGKVLNRFFKSVSFTDSEWEQIIDDIQEGMPKSVICSMYKIKLHHFKVFKKYITGNK